MQSATAITIVKDAQSRPLRLPRAATPDGQRSAAAANLRYVNDAEAGIRRIKSGAGFRYRSDDARAVRELDVLRRIKRLAIPPAWTDVWICRDERGHIQAVGRDAKGRRQYRYHQRWREVRDEAKYGRMRAFGKALSAIRRQVRRHLALPGLPRDKVLATIVRLLETTYVRVGNTEYMRKNGSFGLTTLRCRQVKVKGQSLMLEFRGKGGKLHVVGVTDRRLARVVRRCQDLPGHELFQYVDESGQRRPVTSTDVNEYLREITRQEFTAKDFRTWAGTVLAARALRGVELASVTQGRRSVVAAVASVAKELGNTPAICRRCYVHPAVIDAYLDGRLTRPAALPAAPQSGVAAEEAAVMRLLARPRRSREAGDRRGERRPAR